MHTYKKKRNTIERLITYKKKVLILRTPKAVTTGDNGRGNSNMSNNNNGNDNGDKWSMKHSVMPAHTHFWFVARLLPLQGNALCILLARIKSIRSSFT